MIYPPRIFGTFRHGELLFSFVFFSMLMLIALENQPEKVLEIKLN